MTLIHSFYRSLTLSSFSSRQAPFETPAMSTSIASSDPTVRRRPVVLEKRPNIELLAGDAGVSPVNEASTNTATELSCTRIVVSKLKRPRWLTLVSIFSKNLVRLIVILGLVQMIKKLALKSTDSSGGSLVVVPDFVRRIDEVDSFVKTKMTMMQVQVDVVTPQTRGSVDYPSTRGILVSHENRAESPLYRELYPNTIPANTCPKQSNIFTI